jgi:hypothetical protein
MALHRASLSGNLAKLQFQMRATDLGVASGGLDGRCAFVGDMAKVVGDRFEAPASSAGTVGEIVA